MPDIDYLTYHDIIEICERIFTDYAIRDIGLLESAVERPKTTVFGKDAYKTFEEKAASLMHSLARNHPLIDGNKRLAWSATRIFCIMNGYDFDYNYEMEWVA